jgi:predicted DNA-binding transcriptional regulator YafY
LRNAPTKPFTLTEKRWLKAILQDPRIRLFDLPVQELEDVEPLFTQDMFCWFDRYEDGDPYEDPGYIQNFRHLTQAILQKQNVKLLYNGANGVQTYFCFPYRLEYSEKDDKFRLLAIQKERPLILNLSKIVSCELLEPMSEHPKIPEPQKVKLVLELINQRNALERAMLHFSHLEKETVQMDKRKYRITLWYEPRDERELLIRVLSFGPRLKVVEPASLVEQIKSRIEKQQNLRTL